ncbi:MAG: GatB/YqeY domain-containing protein [Spirochaetota bacterium]|nr:GatB/YqeY domain-containing protein [Spirochaetota bacterium]
MILKEKISSDLKEALKEKDELRVSVLRMVSAAITNREIEKRTKLSKEKSGEDLEKESQLNDDEIISIFFSEVKKRKDSIDQYEKGGRQDLAKKEYQEIKILQTYLPEQLDENELKRLVKEAINKSGAINIKDISKVMGILMPQIKGKADGALVNKIVREELNK